MTSSEGIFTAIERLQRLRVKRLYEELDFALSRTDGTVLRGWGGRAADRLCHLGARRLGGLALLISGLARFSSKEVSGFYGALRGGCFGRCGAGARPNWL